MLRSQPEHEGGRRARPLVSASMGVGLLTCHNVRLPILLFHIRRSLISGVISLGFWHKCAIRNLRDLITRVRRMRRRAMKEAHEPAVNHRWHFREVGSVHFPLRGITLTAGARNPRLRAST